MTLGAILTLGWKDDTSAPAAASRLHEDAEASGEYESFLKRALVGPPRISTVLGVEQLFRRRVGGFSGVKDFVGALAAIKAADAGVGAIRCQVDAFAYAFLKGAKNFDLLLPEDRDARGAFRTQLPDLRAAITALEDFERDGEPLPSRIGFSAKDYLTLRAILVRKSARDERRTLATLLVSGPSTMEEVSADLALNWSLGQRVVSALVPANVLDGPRDDGRWAIAQDAIPLVLFLLREVMGLDYLSALE